MNYFSYKLDHDYGLAPNPFGEYCTLAVCKPSIRRNPNLNINDWIIGTGSKQMGKLHHLIYAMKVMEKLSFNDYWNDPRFQYKKPVLNGSLIQMYGDNFYHGGGKKDEWVQEDSAHSQIDSIEHMENDLSGEWVLVSQEFYYLGDKSEKIPKDLRDVCCEARDMKYKDISDELGEKFIKWVKSKFSKGINGDPTNWTEHSQLNLPLKE